MTLTSHYFQNNSALQNDHKTDLIEPNYVSHLCKSSANANTPSLKFSLLQILRLHRNKQNFVSNIFYGDAESLSQIKCAFPEKSKREEKKKLTNSLNNSPSDFTMLK